jgi:hypothetical protein
MRLAQILAWWKRWLMRFIIQDGGQLLGFSQNISRITLEMKNLWEDFTDKFKPLKWDNIFFNSNYYYIVESEILKNTQWHIFHIFTSEDIDHVTFSIYTIFTWDYIINRTLHDVGLNIWLLSSRVKNTIILTHCARS